MQTDFDTESKLVFGDTKGVLTGNARAGDQELNISLASLTTVVGDASTLTGYAVGGDDTLSGWGNATAKVFGDAFTLTGNSHGGDDYVRSVGQYGTRGYGDGEFMYGRAVGGDDEVSVYSNVDARAYGDARIMTGETVGGNDTIGAGASSHGTATVYGDAERLEGHARGGDDVLYAPADADLWGDAEFVGPHATRGADRFIIEPGQWGSSVMDFEPGKDVVELRGFGPATFEELAGHFVESPQGVLIDFDPEGLSSVFLAGVTADQLSGDDFVFAKLVDEGFLVDENGSFGAGWYHSMTPASQEFVGHAGERDVYIRDMGLYDLTSTATPQGFDTIDSFELGLDEIIIRNSDFTLDEDNFNTVVSRELQHAPTGEVFAVAFYQHQVIGGEQTITEVPGRLVIESFV